MNRKNLLKLADYLDKHVRSGNFVLDDVIEWATVVPGLEKKKEDYVPEGFSSNFYSVRVFGVAEAQGEWMEPHPVWEWVFHESWWEYDETPLGVSRRIRYLLKHGETRVRRLMFQMDDLEYDEVKKLYRKEVYGE